MDKKDWVVPIITGVIGIVGALGAGMLAGQNQERIAFQQAQVELTKISAADRTAGIKELKDAAARYIAANDAFVSAVELFPNNEEAIVNHLSKVQTAGAEIIVIGDEELARYTNSVNAYCAMLLTSGNQPPVDQRLENLATIRSEWMKQLRRSLETQKKQSEENLIIHSSWTAQKRGAG